MPNTVAIVMRLSAAMFLSPRSTVVRTIELGVHCKAFLRIAGVHAKVPDSLTNHHQLWMPLAH